MRKSVLQNAPVSDVISRMGHGDSLCIGDAGLPIPANVTRIDLALKRGVPSMLDVACTIAGELQIEKVMMAREVIDQQPAYHHQIEQLLLAIEGEQNTKIERILVSHEDFKAESAQCRAVVRTGECTPYANLIFFAGVAF